MVVTADMAGSMAAGASTKMICNAYEGKKLSEGVLQQAVISGVTGGIAAGAAIGTSNLISSVSDSAGRIIMHTTAGAIVSGTTGGLGCLLHNIMHNKRIEKSELITFLEECGATNITAEHICEELEKQGYITAKG